MPVLTAEFVAPRTPTSDRTSSLNAVYPRTLSFRTPLGQQAPQRCQAHSARETYRLFAR